MHWVKLDLATLRSQRFTECEPLAQATWLQLLAYCADQENGGTICGASEWGDRMWMRCVGITKDESRIECGLWEWDDGDIVIWGYCTDAEDLLRKRRQAGKKGGQARPKQCLSSASSKGQAIRIEESRSEESRPTSDEAHPDFTGKAQEGPSKPVVTPEEDWDWNIVPKGIDKRMQEAGMVVSRKNWHQWRGVIKRKCGTIGDAIRMAGDMTASERKWPSDFEEACEEAGERERRVL